ncbi:MAG: hypothetical protein KKE44_04560 [Proteobacteria bacterium]|nr:hypothetical protein [Pseudomonadota bacterium]MBU1582003.1 hypothetical protein [Pseudomonadota bacterium]MBU2455318.1 hypothetical protein [Pseudomonadota bacterium]
MDEFVNILKKYEKSYIKEHLKDLDNLNVFALSFYKDVSEIYDCLTRVKNIERNPSGYSLNDAPIIGLLVKIWKLLKEIIIYYERNNAEMIGVLERPLLESTITSAYLMQSENEVIEDYRKCSYKDRLRILRELKEGSPFFETKAGKRILKSVNKKMALENYTIHDFKEQKQNRWRVQGKSFYDIFKEIENENLYKCTFGMMSESIHCSWNDSMDWCLQRNDDGTFDVFPFYHPADIRYVTPTLAMCNRTYRMWLKHINVDDKYINDILNWIEKVNSMLYVTFDQLYDE